MPDALVLVGAVALSLPALALALYARHICDILGVSGPEKID
jgi:hypothetical protein